MAELTKLRIALVAASPRLPGGHSVQVELLMRHWQGDPEVEVRFVPVNPALPRSLAWVEQIPGLRTLARQPLYWAALWAVMRDVQAVHVFSASYFSFWLAPFPAWVIAHLRGKRVLIHYHSGEARDHLRRSKLAVAVLRRADLLVVPSQFLVAVFREFRLGAHEIPNVVDLAEFRYRLRRPVRPYLVCTRGFHPYYRADLVIQAFAEVQKNFPEARLCLPGSGRLEPRLRELVRNLRLTRVDFVGTVPHSDIARLYDQADVFINASYIDNMPVSILEAFASGTPVVTTAPEGIAYLVEHEMTGLLCAPGDWKGLADNVVRLLRDPDLASRLAEKARERARACSWQQVRPQWLEAYRNLVSERV